MPGREPFPAEPSANVVEEPELDRSVAKRARVRRLRRIILVDKILDDGGEGRVDVQNRQRNPEKHRRFERGKSVDRKPLLAPKRDGGVGRDFGQVAVSRDRIKRRSCRNFPARPFFKNAARFVGVERRLIPMPHIEPANVVAPLLQNRRRDAAVDAPRNRAKDFHCLNRLFSQNAQTPPFAQFAQNSKTTRRASRKIVTFYHRRLFFAPIER